MSLLPVWVASLLEKSMDPGGFMLLEQVVAHSPVSNARETLNMLIERKQLLAITRGNRTWIRDATITQFPVLSIYEAGTCLAVRQQVTSASFVHLDRKEAGRVLGKIHLDNWLRPLVHAKCLVRDDQATGKQYQGFYARGPVTELVMICPSKGQLTQLLDLDDPGTHSALYAKFPGLRPQSKAEPDKPVKTSVAPVAELSGDTSNVTTIAYLRDTLAAFKERQRIVTDAERLLETLRHSNVSPSAVAAIAATLSDQLGAGRTLSVPLTPEEVALLERSLSIWERLLEVS